MSDKEEKEKKTYRDGRRLVNDHQVVVEVDDAHGISNHGSLVSARPFGGAFDAFVIEGREVKESDGGKRERDHVT